MENMKQQDEMRLLAEVTRGSGQAIRLQRKTYKGSDYFDLRLFWENDEGEIIPTRKGVSFRLDEPEKVRTILSAWQAEMDRLASLRKGGGDS